MSGEFDTFNTDEAVCPHCNYEHQDSWEFSDSQDVDCYACGKPFHCERQITITYTTKPLTK
jgi:Zn ribbon nucleic-acid-binding protein